LPDIITAIFIQDLGLLLLSSGIKIFLTISDPKLAIGGKLP
jgi:hypothetical protein